MGYGVDICSKILCTRRVTSGWLFSGLPVSVVVLFANSGLILYLQSSLPDSRLKEVVIPHLRK